MKLTQEERMDIGRQMCNKEISYTEVMEKYGVSQSCAHKWLTDYKRVNEIPLCNTHKRPQETPGNSIKLLSKGASEADIEAYMSMSKEELINALILAKVNEARAKKRYEVKGDGATKEFVPLNKKNSKS